MNSLTAILLGIVLLVLNGVFVAAEFAVISAKRHRLEEASSGRMARLAARAAVRSSRQLSIMLAGAQLGITLCSLGLGMVTEPAIHHLLEPLLGALPAGVQTALSYVVALAIVTFLHMVVGEMAPKSLALTHPEQSALALAIPFRGFVWLVRPVLASLNGLTNALLRACGVRPKDELATTRTPHQLAVLVAESGRMGMLDRNEHDLLTRALRAQTQTVGRLMTPLTEAPIVRSTTPAHEIHDLAAATGNLRMLVTENDRICGVLHLRDTLIHPATPLATLVTPAPHIPATATIPDALTTLQDAHAHLAAVTDQVGRPVGVISLNTLTAQLLTV
ncbi:hemolysin family protein [Acrocarpospora catenulata]|uniref:hemolysin family protein n=1 Tax=Acrocarpospora catenulata TaxID=2836182 RepID=UPI001BD961F1|nr:hemolysin family protein [Acrocarpospora catenulata]